MKLYAKIILAVLVIGGVIGGIGWGLWAFCDACGDAREAEVRNEWKQEKLDLIAARDAAERQAAENRKTAEGEKQVNTQRGEKAIEETSNIDRDWTDTNLPPGMYDALRQN